MPLLWSKREDKHTLKATRCTRLTHTCIEIVGTFCVCFYSTCVAHKYPNTSNLSSMAHDVITWCDIGDLESVGKTKISSGQQLILQILQTG